MIGSSAGRPVSPGSPGAVPSIRSSFGPTRPASQRHRPSGRGCRSGPRCGRLRDRGSPRRRRPANHGGLAQADEPIRPDGPPGEDSPGAVPTAPSRRLRDQGTGATRTDDLRLPGIHPLLGTIPARPRVVKRRTAGEPTRARASALRNGVERICTSRSRNSTRSSPAKARGHYGYYLRDQSGTFRAGQRTLTC